MRRSSFTPLAPEPLIVVEESGAEVSEGEDEGAGAGAQGGGAAGGMGAKDTDDNDDSPQDLEPDDLLNPYLLSPWRDTRKRSLPTPACTSGITASQVRRLSERGPESGPSPREQEFLATLSAAPAPAPGGRRHSVVTISRAPPSSVIFGKNRRESIGVFGATGLRRDSSTSSSHNLQLDIMDDIANIKAARKNRLRGSRDRLQETGDAGGPSGSTVPSRRGLSAGQGQRRHSEYATTSPPATYAPFRRRSELPPANPASQGAASCAPATTSPPAPIRDGIVCSNSDLMTIMSSLTSSAQEIHKVPEDDDERPTGRMIRDSGLPHPVTRRDRLKGFRSNSFDVGLLVESGAVRGDKRASNKSSNWLTNRHQPMATKDKSNLNSSPVQQQPVAVMVSLHKDKPTVSVAPTPATRCTPPTSLTEVVCTEPVSNPRKGSISTAERDHKRSKVLWDNRSGSLVDAHLLGSAIEGFLNKDTPDKKDEKKEPGKAGAKSSISSWFSALSAWSSSGQTATAATRSGDDDSDSCNTLCSTLKDLFVK